MSPQLIFGTAIFGQDLTDFQDAAAIEQLLKELQKLGVHRLDSGARYPPRMPGRSEELIGETKDVSGGFVVDTKVITDIQNDGSGDLTPEAIEKSTLASLKRLQRPEGVNILHIHRADPATPLEDQIKGFNKQIKQGRCKAWGVSNVPPDMLEKMLKICDEKGYQKPSCYQGDYNVVTRGMEKTLLPLMRAHGMTFNAFRPLAAGFLTAKLVNGNHQNTRFDDNNPTGKFLAEKFFGAEDLHIAMRNFDVQVRSHNITPLETAIRWIAHHSGLDEQDGIIIGASRVEQVVETVGMIRKGPLPKELVDVANQTWNDVEESRKDVI